MLANPVPTMRTQTVSNEAFVAKTKIVFPTVCGHVHCYCGSGWVTRSSTTGGDPGGTTAYATCCRCGDTIKAESHVFYTKLCS